MPKENLDDRITIRLLSKERTRFEKYCSKTLSRNPSEVIREMMVALSDSRLKITPTKTQTKSHGELYDVN